MSFRSRILDNPWRLMIAVNAVVVIAVLVEKIGRPPYVPYIHLLVDYRFGFTKRAFIGALVSPFFTKVPVWLVFAIGGAVWLLTLVLFIELFRRTFRFGDKHLPLFVFMACSPFFFKNFMFSLGHFDIYGCMLAIVLLLIPARSIVFVLIAAAASLILILIHHIHFLMYIPTIAMIVAIRYYLVQGLTRQNAVAGILSIAAVSLLFVAAQFRGSITIPQDEFIRYLQTRLADPSQSTLLVFADIWYQGLTKEISDTWASLPSNLLSIPVYAALIAIHLPLWRYFADLIRSLADGAHRRIVIAGMISISLGYLIIFAIVFDYARWISNWAVCMFLILHAVKTLPASRPVQFDGLCDRRSSILGWIVTIIPRVGIRGI